MIKNCSICLLGEDFPGIKIYNKNICNICLYYQKNQHLFNFTKYKEKKNLLNLKNFLISNKNHNYYDCIIGVSGGVDSSYLVFIAYKLGLNPLLVTIDNGWNSLSSYENISKIIDYTNFDLKSIHLDWKKFKLIQKKLITKEIGDLEIATDHYIFSNLFETARKEKIKSILIGNNFAAEHTVLKDIGWNKRDGDHIKKILNFDDNFFDKELKLFSYLYFLFLGKLKIVNEISVLNLINYNTEKAIIQMKEAFGYKTYETKHYESTFTKFFQGYYLVKKFNIDKRKIHLSERIRNNLITLEDASAQLKLSPISENQIDDLKKFFKKKIGLSDYEMKNIDKVSKDFKHIKISTSLRSKFIYCLIFFYKKIIEIKNIFKNRLFNFGYSIDNKKYSATLTLLCNIQHDDNFFNCIKDVKNHFLKKNWGIFNQTDNNLTDFVLIINPTFKSFLISLKYKLNGAKIIVINLENNLNTKYKNIGAIKFFKILNLIQKKLINFLSNDNFEYSDEKKINYDSLFKKFFDEIKYTFK